MKPVIVKRAQRYDSVLIQALEIRPLFIETVGQVVKTRGRFGGVTPPLAKGGAIFIFHHAVMTESISAVYGLTGRPQLKSEKRLFPGLKTATQIIFSSQHFLPRKFLNASIDS